MYKLFSIHDMDINPQIKYWHFWWLLWNTNGHWTLDLYCHNLLLICRGEYFINTISRWGWLRMQLSESQGWPLCFLLYRISRAWACHLWTTHLPTHLQMLLCLSNATPTTSSTHRFLTIWLLLHMTRGWTMASLPIALPSPLKAYWMALGQRTCLKHRQCRTFQEFVWVLIHVAWCLVGTRCLPM